MNKNVLVAILVIVMVAAASFLVYGIIKNTTASKVDSQPAEAGSNVTSAPGESEASCLAAAVDFDKKGDLLKAREAYQKLVEKYPTSSAISKNQEALDNLNIKILFSPVPTPDSLMYEVQKGDTLNRIAKNFNTTADLISKANGLKDATVKVGRKLKITKAKFSVVVDKSQNILTLKSDQEILKTYRVSTGKDSCTPVGTFKVTNKLIDPPWYPSAGGMIPAKDPKNVLGSRWLGISKQGYGIHGTTEPESIGKSVTEGCVRMKNADVEELYSIVPIGTEVVILN